MQAVVLPFSESKDLKMLLDLARRLQIPFRIQEVESFEPESLETITVRTRLTEKYVSTGEWDNMDDDERQDASLLEMMLFAEEQPDYKIYSVEESAQMLADLKAECHAD